MLQFTLILLRSRRQYASDAEQNGVVRCCHVLLSDFLYKYFNTLSWLKHAQALAGSELPVYV